MISIYQLAGRKISLISGVVETHPANLSPLTLITTHQLKRTWIGNLKRSKGTKPWFRETLVSLKYVIKRKMIEIIRLFLIEIDFIRSFKHFKVIIVHLTKPWFCCHLIFKFSPLAYSVYHCTLPQVIFDESQILTMNCCHIAGYG